MNALNRKSSREQKPVDHSSAWLEPEVENWCNFRCQGFRARSNPRTSSGRFRLWPRRVRIRRRLLKRLAVFRFAKKLFVNYRPCKKIKFDCNYIVNDHCFNNLLAAKTKVFYDYHEVYYSITILLKMKKHHNFCFLRPWHKDYNNIVFVWFYLPSCP